MTSATSIRFYLLFLALLSTVTLHGQIELSVESIFNSRQFALESPGAYAWRSGDQGYVSLESFGTSIVNYNPVSRESQVLVQIQDFGDNRSGWRFFTYNFSTDNSKLLVGLRGNNGQAYGLVDFNNGENIILELDDYIENIQSVQLSPDGQKVAFVHHSNIYVLELANMSVIQLTKDGKGSVINANSTSRFNSANNTRGYRWNPDSESVAYIQFNTAGIKDFTLINNTDALYPKLVKFQNIKPGEPLPSARIGVVDITGGTTTWMQIPGDPKNNYLPVLSWTPDGKQALIQQLNRNQNTMKVFLGNPQNGEVSLLHTEQDKAYVETNPLRWTKGGKSFVWISEKDGWRHLYSIDVDNKKETLLTPGEFDVVSLVSIDHTKGWVYYMASPESAIHRYLFRAKLNGSGKIEKVSPHGIEGTYQYNISPSGKWAFTTFSKFGTPPKTSLVSLPNHKEQQVFQDNSALSKKLGAMNFNAVEFSKVDIGDGIALDTWSIKPPDFDPKRKYPVIFHVYSMPAFQAAVDRWQGSNYLFYRLLAQQGYIVMGIDGRGTPSLYGREWRKSIYKKHGILPADDIAAAVKVMTKERPYMDSERIGVYGWSGGGLMSMLLILRHPDTFHVAIPGAFISHHKYYHAGFTERFLGLPEDNPEAYEETAALNYAKNLKGELLIMHGTGDDNVHYQNTEAMMNALIAAKKQFTVLPYPNRRHGMREGVNTKVHQYDTYLWFFGQHLLKPSDK